MRNQDLNLYTNLYGVTAVQGAWGGSDTVCLTREEAARGFVERLRRIQNTEEGFWRKRRIESSRVSAWKRGVTFGTDETLGQAELLWKDGVAYWNIDSGATNLISEFTDLVIDIGEEVIRL